MDEAGVCCEKAEVAEARVTTVIRRKVYLVIVTPRRAPFPPGSRRPFG
jgi:hypothetical protein